MFECKFYKNSSYKVLSIKTSLSHCGHYCPVKITNDKFFVSLVKLTYIIKTDKKQGKENLYPAFNIFNRNKLFAQLAHNFICKVVVSFFKTFTKNKSVKFNNVEFTRNQLFDSLFWVLNKWLFYQTSVSH